MSFITPELFEAVSHSLKNNELDLKLDYGNILLQIWRNGIQKDIQVHQKDMNCFLKISPLSFLFYIHFDVSRLRYILRNLLFSFLFG